MNREEKIQKIAKEIQDKIEKLKKFNCSITGYIGGIGVVDYNIENKGIDDTDDIVYSFNTSFHSKS